MSILSFIRDDIIELSGVDIIDLYNYQETLNNHIGINEPITTATINRCIDEIYKIQVLLLRSIKVLLGYQQHHIPQPLEHTPVVHKPEPEPGNSPVTLPSQDVLTGKAALDDAREDGGSDDEFGWAKRHQWTDTPRWSRTYLSEITRLQNQLNQDE